MGSDTEQLKEKIGLIKKIWRSFWDMNKFQKSMVLAPVVIIIVLVGFIITGCQTNPNKELVKLELENVNKMMKDYPARIKADPKWSDITKKVYIKWLNSWKFRLDNQLEAIELEEKNK